MRRKSCFAPLTTIVVLAVMLFACTSPRHRAVLDGADSLMSARPDSALTLLNALLPDTNQMAKRELMRFHLLRTNAENKCDTVLSARHAALMRRVCDYYDHRSSKREANNRMLAHYLLGRCYSDMGEAPAALYEFNNAVDAADTTSANCDHKTLLRIHAQLANLFYMQDLFEKQLSELLEVTSLSKKTNDFLSEMWARECEANVFEAMGKEHESLTMLESARRELLQNGYRTEAARLSGIILSILVDLKRYDSIGSRVYEYEHYSGFLDTAGNIEPSKALYFVYKAKYLLHCGKTDSAVSLFKKCLHKDYSLETRLAGARELESYYESKGHAVDSTLKYARLSSRLNDSLRREMRTRALTRQESSHKYSSFRSKADQLMIKNEQAKRQRQLLLFTFIVLLLIGGYIGIALSIKIKSLRKEKEERQRELERIKSAYRSALERHEEMLSVLQFLKEEQEEKVDVIKRYQENIDEQEKHLSEMNSEIFSLKQQLADAERKADSHQKDTTIQQVDSLIAHFDILEKISNCLSANPPRTLSLVEIRQLREEFREKYPSFYQRLVIEYKLPLKKYDICLLYRLGIKPASIASLLGVGRSSVTMERHRIYESVYGRYDENGEFENFLKDIV